MNFDYGALLTRTWQITWRHKVIWLLVALPLVPSFLLLPLIFLPMLYLAGGGDASDPAGLVYLILILITFLLVIVANYILGAVSSASATLGIVRAERGSGSLRLMDLLQDSLAYFWRVLAIMLIVGLTFGLLSFIFSMLAILLILVTIGMAAICIQPLMILLTPLMFLVVGFLEAANTAVIAGDMQVMDAIRRAWQIVRANIWKYVLITLIVYFGTSILSSFIMVPLMMPAFALPFLMDGSDAGWQLMIATVILFACIFFPLMFLLSSISGTFMKASLDLTCLWLIGTPQKTTPAADPIP
jgi:hypothetical protein